MKYEDRRAQSTLTNQKGRKEDERQITSVLKYKLFSYRTQTEFTGNGLEVSDENLQDVYKFDFYYYSTAWDLKI